MSSNMPPHGNQDNDNKNPSGEVTDHDRATTEEPTRTPADDQDSDTSLFRLKAFKSVLSKNAVDVRCPSHKTHTSTDNKQRETRMKQIKLLLDKRLQMIKNLHKALEDQQLAVRAAQAELKEEEKRVLGERFYKAMWESSQNDDVCEELTAAGCKTKELEALVELDGKLCKAIEDANGVLNLV
ncbi:uncharacterized protein BKA78DRAFT_305157 [Phyllosticta capitalensis]|uniref:uncharacterized protein n=1 Tax=Phyllosticta capitalensis TaxID=121624 RepID=UPI00312D437B